METCITLFKFKSSVHEFSWNVSDKEESTTYFRPVCIARVTWLEDRGKFQPTESPCPSTTNTTRRSTLRCHPSSMFIRSELPGMEHSSYPETEDIWLCLTLHAKAPNAGGNDIYRLAMKHKHIHFGLPRRFAVPLGWFLWFIIASFGFWFSGLWVFYLKRTG